MSWGLYYSLVSVAVSSCGNDLSVDVVVAVWIMSPCATFLACAKDSSSGSGLL